MALATAIAQRHQPLGQQLGQAVKLANLAVWPLKLIRADVFIQKKPAMGRQQQADMAVEQGQIGAVVHAGHPQHGVKTAGGKRRLPHRQAVHIGLKIADALQPLGLRLSLRHRQHLGRQINRHDLARPASLGDFPLQRAAAASQHQHPVQGQRLLGGHRLKKPAQRRHLRRTADLAVNRRAHLRQMGPVQAFGSPGIRVAPGDVQLVGQTVINGAQRADK